MSDTGEIIFSKNIFPNNKHISGSVTIYNKEINCIYTGLITSKMDNDGKLILYISSRPVYPLCVSFSGYINITLYYIK